MLLRARPLTSTKRGFLLIDVMIAGAIAAVVIAGVLSVLASARAKNVAAARDVVASQLVLERLDQVRSLPFISVITQASAPVAGTTGTYNRSVTVVSSSESIGGFTMAFKDVTVAVTYKTNEGRIDSKVRTSQATTRIYR